MKPKVVTALLFPLFAAAATLLWGLILIGITPGGIHTADLSMAIILGVITGIAYSARIYFALEEKYGKPSPQ